MPRSAQVDSHPRRAGAAAADEGYDVAGEQPLTNMIMAAAGAGRGHASAVAGILRVTRVVVEGLAAP